MNGPTDPLVKVFSDRPIDAVVLPCPTDPMPTHWIEIELVGEDHQPIPYAAYEMRLPDGTEVQGYLDAEGFARFDRLPAAGLCGLRFPELDKDAWEFIATLPARDARSGPDPTTT